MSAIVNVNRREFLRVGAVAGGSLLLGVYLPLPGAAALAEETKGAPFAPNAFLRIGADESVTVIINHSEMGQGVSTALAMLLADELDADWHRIRVEFSGVDPAYNHTAFGPVQMTGGSTTMWSEWERYRKMGAAGRAMLVAAAAQEWGVDAAACTAESGFVVHQPSGRRLSFGALAAKASGLAVPEEVALKTPDRFRFIGKPMRRIDTREKVDGTARFGIDVARPEMLVAVVERPPVFGGTVKTLDAGRARGVKGVRHVVPIDRGVAVVADDFWSATQGREALVVEWDEGKLAGLGSAAQGEAYAALARTPGKVAHGTAGDAAAALARSARTLAAVYELPYLAHAPMEPLNCVADVRADRCEIWVGTQSQTIDRNAAASAAGLEPEQVTLHTTLLGGGFGRRAVLDSHFVVEAVQVSKAVKRPVKVIWTREDDIRGGYFRPRAVHAVQGGVDAAGKVQAWHHRIVCQSIVAGTMFESAMFRDGVDESAVEGVSDMAYAIPHRQVEWHQAPAGIPVLWWRSVGHSHTAFAVESFLDELAHAAGRDPLAVRLELLAEAPRHRRVLELAAAKAGWGNAAPAGRGRGLAVHASFGSFVAQVAEVSVSAKGAIRVHRVVAAIDCGPVVNPETIRAQVEGAIVYGLSAALHGQITFAKGRVQQSNFHDYPALRMSEMPEVEVHIVESGERMGGVGEPGLPPIAPAVANAVFAATGQRLRRLPFRLDAPA
ncbi:MAG: xanthine dehydrogenase family protein molybdopterin-binding subunit [Thermoanaerobaculia bacterium]|nr:xanthine dehydrogenase family protein molybdopterin-binding subunit [Thermoanaerobaculia bacterium]